MNCNDNINDNDGNLSGRFDMVLFCRVVDRSYNTHVYITELV
jgi:hypothetical protein